MASRDTITNRRYRTRAASIALLVAVLLAPAARGADPKPARGIVRLQGYRVAPTEAPANDEMVLNARGVDHRFRVTDRRRFELAQSGQTPAHERDRLTLQADFDVLARFAKARPDQQITILGEQRAGSSDLFILTLDLCPP